MTGLAEPTREQLARRVSRARLLAGTHTASRELLTFYAAVSGFQMALLDDRPRVARVIDADAHRFGDALNAAAASALIPDALRWLAAQPQPELLLAAQALAAADAARWASLLESAWHQGAVEDDADDVERFVVEMLLQPFAEALARGRVSSDGADAAGGPLESAGPMTCPVCAGLPVVATLREKGHGARRSLVCGFCLTEWPMPRVICPACGESSFDRLAVYRAEEYPAVRIDACDNCHKYIKTVDLTVDGHAIPVVDDVATLPTDFWADEHGYRKLRPNLLRV